MRRKTTTRVAPHYVLCRKTGEEIFVNSENASEYRNSVDFIRLNKPVKPATAPILEQPDPPADDPPPAKKASAKKKAAAKKAPVKKKAASRK